LSDGSLAPNKRKILETARKLAQKGAKEKALKEYQKLVKLDPKDAKLRLEIGDAHRRWGQVEEAIETYSKVAEQYTKEGFDARAVAVFKQILNLDPNRFESYQPLAELYERMGLTAEAINSLQTAADGFHKQGKKREALDLLRKMATIDPTNTTSRIKVAELLRQEELHEEAIAEYDFVSEELEGNNDVEALVKIYERILEIEPDRTVTLVKIARTLLTRRDPAKAEPFAAHAIEVGPDEPEHYELLADIYRCQDKQDEMSGVYRRLAELFRERGEEDRARDILQRYVPAKDLAVNGEDAAGSSGDALDDGEFLQSDDLPDGDLSDDDFSGEELLLDHELTGDGEVSADADEELALDIDELVGDPLEVSAADQGTTLVEPAAVAAPGPTHDVDADQLLAEASVYLRYGKCDKAVSHLERILGADPDHRLALEKLGEAYAESGEPEKAVDLFMRAVKRAREDDDEAAVAVLRGRIAGLDESAAASLDAPPATPSPDPDPAAPSLEPSTPAEADDELLLDADADEIEIVVDDEDDIELAAEEAVAETDEIELGTEQAVAETDEIEIAAEEAVAETDEIELGTEQAVAETDEIEIATEEAVAETDEIEFGAEQAVGETDEIEIGAEQAVAETEEVEIEAEQAVAAADETVIAAEDAAAEEFDADEIEIDIDVEDDLDAAAAPAAPTEEAATVEAEEAPPTAASLADVADTSFGGASLSSSTTQQTLDDLEEADFYMQQGLIGEAEEIYKRVLAVAPNHPRALARLGEVAAARGAEPEAQSADSAAAVVEEAPEVASPPAVAEETAPEFDDEIQAEPPASTELEDDLADLDIDDDDSAPAEDAEFAAEEGLDAPTEEEVIAAAEPAEVSAPPAAVPAASAPVLGDGFDLAAELSGAFVDNSSSASFTGGTPDDGFASVFEAFKKGVSETLAEGDHDTHYDLGIAYKEMGLLDDAMQEFRVAMESSLRRVECLHLIGVCALEAGQPQVALEHLSQLLDSPDLGGEQQLAGQLELGRAHQALGDVVQARVAFEAVEAVDPSFCGVSDLIAGLGEPPAPEEAPAEEPDAFESFEDVISDAAEEEEPESDPGETFQDLVDEANAEPVEDEPAEHAPPAEPMAPAPEPPAEPAAAASPPKKKRKKKKKISFV
jgi:tetratricopeptide (TPR) repeat protein